MIKQRYYTIVIFILIPFCFIDCKTNENVLRGKKRQLIFGMAGGFTGVVTEYKLNTSGEIYYKDDKDGEYKLTNMITRQQTKAVFEKADSLGLLTLTMDFPGNVTKFIEYKVGSTSNLIKWGAPKKSVPPSIADFHKELMGIVKPKNKK